MRTDRTTAATTAADTGIDFGVPLGAPAYFEPDSVQWRVYKNQVALGIGGICAVLLEFADPRIRTGVWDHSTYKVDPIGRSRRTGLAAMVGVYGPRGSAEAMIAGITRMHARVTGETPDGRHYAALDPELLNWVAATAGYGFMAAYDRFVRPLSAGDQAAFWSDAAPLTALYGVTESPASDSEFLAMMDALAPGFESHPIINEFLDIVETGQALGKAPRFVRRAVVRAAVSLLPPLARDRLELGSGYDLTRRDLATIRLLARIAERRFDPKSPPARACERLGLPANFLWRKPSERARLLTAARTAGAPAAPTTG